LLISFMPKRSFNWGESIQGVEDVHDVHENPRRPNVTILFSVD
jgi:hypothetical protein